MSDLRQHVKGMKAIADAIPILVDGIEKIKRDSGLSDRAIIILAADAAGLGKPTTKKVIDALSKLKELYLEPETNKGDTRESN